MRLLADPARAPWRRRVSAWTNHRYSRPRLVPFALAGVFGLAMLVAGCGGSSSPGVAAVGTGTTSASTTTTANSSQSSQSSTQLHGALAFSRCMREHGVQNFPDPDSQGNFPPLTQQALDVSKQTSSAANDACRHLLSGGGSATSQQRQQKLAFGVKVAQCLRAHGYPNFPDPTGSGQSLPPGIDTTSPRFQTIETACEKQEQNALGLP
ncbi:MAG TPA: hypothetical protein VGH56_00725 [Solirubrobacteraceae bacterium]